MKLYVLFHGYFFLTLSFSLFGMEEFSQTTALSLIYKHKYLLEGTSYITELYQVRSDTTQKTYVVKKIKNYGTNNSSYVTEVGICNRQIRSTSTQELPYKTLSQNDSKQIWKAQKKAWAQQKVTIKNK